MVEKKLNFENSKKENFDLNWFNHLGAYTKINIFGEVQKQNNGRKVGRGLFDGEVIFVDVKTGLQIKEKEIGWYLLQEDFSHMDNVIKKFKEKMKKVG